MIPLAKSSDQSNAKKENIKKGEIYEKYWDNWHHRMHSSETRDDESEKRTPVKLNRKCSFITIDGYNCNGQTMLLTEINN